MKEGPGRLVAAFRAYLENVPRSWKVQDLAREARVSLGQASNVKKVLEDREWVERSTKGVRLSQPDKLRAAWADHNSLDKYRA